MSSWMMPLAEEERGDRERLLARLETVRLRIEARVATHERLQGWVIAFLFVALGTIPLMASEPGRILFGGFNPVAVVVVLLLLLLAGLIDARAARQSDSDLFEALSLAAYLDATPASDPELSFHDAVAVTLGLTTDQEPAQPSP
ncbi:MAG: hypothetical protein HY815_05960 [Candidatus Riflebacteria bacterium]|nr:hypothetical protein [Candidatus Riflebacteria bacterium]